MPDRTVPAGRQPFSVVVERNGEVGLMRLVGELDIETSEEVLATIRAADAEGITQWAIDCSDLAFVDSGGLRAILAVAGQVGGLDSIALYEPQQQLVNLLVTAGLSEAITIRDAETTTDD